eukprot:g2698.t1
MCVRQKEHPLIKEDPEIESSIRFVRIEFYETIRAPVPRYQEMPIEAFGKLHGRAVLAAVSQPWFYQYHPDPRGKKLKILQEILFPTLRKRYPHTDILIFNDWMCCPQRPRTEEDERRFSNAMKKMNNVYLYCDTTLHIHTTLPPIDVSPLTKFRVRPKDYSFANFVDNAVQVAGASNGANAGLRKGDIVRKMYMGPSNTKEVDVRDAKQIGQAIDSCNDDGTILLGVRRCPFGRRNPIPCDDRGWVFIERVTTAVKAASAGKEAFDAIVLSNSCELSDQIYRYSDLLRRSVRRKTKGESLKKTLATFEGELSTKSFTYDSDRASVQELMSRLVRKFSSNWDSEMSKQRSMSKRTKEILMRWGSFSPQYVSRAGLERDSAASAGERVSFFIGGSIALLAAALTPALIYALPIVPDPGDVDREATWWKPSLLLGLSMTFALSAFIHISNHEFASIPFGTHTLLGLALQCFVFFAVWQTMFLATDTIVPLGFVLTTVVSIGISELIFSVKFIPRRNPITKIVQYWNLGAWIYMPSHLRFSLKARYDVRCVMTTTHLTLGFGFIYPFLSAIFYQVHAVLQCVLIPIFFVVRTAYIALIDSVAGGQFGSDKLPPLHFLGVALHEMVLTVMISNVKHPIVFIVLVLFDVGENLYCLWSLWRVAARRSGVKVSPATQVAKGNSRLRRRSKTLEKRSTTLRNVMRALTDDDSDQNGTRYFIVAMLIQRELIDMIVPVQAAAILSILYASGSKLNAFVVQWTEEHFIEAMTFIGVDLLIEMIVFLMTLHVLHAAFPMISIWNVIHGVALQHYRSFVGYTCSCWFAILLFQYTYTGMDITLNFDWLRCAEDGYFLGGFDWASSSNETDCGQL